MIEHAVCRREDHGRVAGHPRRAGLPASVFLAAALLTACGGGDEGGSGAAAPPAPAAEQSANVPDGYRVVAVAEAGFSLAVPREWKNLPLDAVDLKEFIESNPEFGLDPNKPPQTSFQAYSPDQSGTNVNVLKTTAGGASLSDLESGLAEVLVSQLKATEVTVTSTEIAAGKAIRTSFRYPVQKPSGGTIIVRSVQHIVIADDVQYVLTVSLFGSGVSTAVADTIGGTLRLL